ncbi:hypothetical protein HKX48_003382 [Thoreauomyces humboldtii]|nr:hypothetical protein HKX48_003382 [Thoreauomyces humboldtii]
MPKKKGAGGAKGKKAPTVLPPFFDYTTHVTPQWTPPVAEPEKLSALASHARSAIQDRLANPSVLLRVRQSGWEDFHDVFVQAEKKMSVLWLQGVIAERIHGGSVNRGDVMVFLTTDKEEEALANKVADKMEGVRVNVAGAGTSDGEEKDGEEGKGDSEGAKKESTGDGETGTALTTEAKENNSPLAPTVVVNASGSAPLRVRPTANPQLPLDVAFPDISVSKNPSSLSASAEFLPPGHVMFVHELHARLTERARAIQQASIARSSTVTSNAGSITGRRMTINSGTSPGARRASFMMAKGLSFSDQPLPPIQLPHGFEIWYDVQLPPAYRRPSVDDLAMRSAQDRADAADDDKENEDWNANVKPSLLAEHRPSVHVSSNPIIMFENYIAKTANYVARRGGMTGIADQLPVAPPVPAVVPAPAAASSPTKPGGRKRAGTLGAGATSALGGFTEDAEEEES